MNNIYLIVGASGSGKTTIQTMLCKQHNLVPLESYTTRPKRTENETGHIFINNETFAQLKNIVAYTEFCNHKYCATAQQIEQVDLYVIDPKGVDFFKAAYHGKKGVKVIYINSPLHTRFNRMEAEGRPFADCLERVVNDALAFHPSVTDRIVDFTVQNNDNTKLASVANQIWNYIRTIEKIEDNTFTNDDFLCIGGD